MKKYLAPIAALLFLSAGTVNAALITDEVLDPAASYSSPTWTHTFDAGLSIESATIDLTHHYFGYYEYDAVPTYGLYADGIYLGPMTDCDPDYDAEADMDPSCSASYSITDHFSIADLGLLADGELEMTISAHDWDYWYASSSELTITTVPVPAPLALLGLGLIGLVATRRLA